MFDVDASELYAVTALEVQRLRAAPGVLAELGARAALEERQTHRYVNRTGQLQQSTMSIPTGFGLLGDFGIVLGASMPYAGYVAAKGLMNLDRLARGIEDRFLEIMRF